MPLKFFNLVSLSMHLPAGVLIKYELVFYKILFYF